MPRAVRASAPGKVIILGEHAVVRGKRALAAAVECRIFVEVQEWSGPTCINLRDLGYEGLLSDNCESANRSIGNSLNAAKEVISWFNVAENMKIIIQSDIPEGSGMGSSAAFSVALVAAISTFSGNDLDRNEIFKYARKLEFIFHGFSSGVDPACSTFGGLLLYSIENGPTVVSSQLLPLYEVLLVDTNITRSTQDVNEHLKRILSRHPDLNLLFDEVDEIVGDAVSHRLSIMDAMKRNEEILEKLGLLHPEALNLMQLCKDNNMVAKITGAGLGGCVLICSARPFPIGFQEMIKDLGFTPLPLNLGEAEGVHVEEIGE